MNDVVQGALVGGGFATLANVANLVFNHLSQRMERDERYRISLYDKRLTVHQQAFKWTYDLVGPLNEFKPGDASASERLIKSAKDARDWWDENALYLYPLSRSEFSRLIFSCITYATGSTKSAEVWAQWNKVERAVQQDFGEKHVDPEALERARRIRDE